MSGTSGSVADVGRKYGRSLLRSALVWHGRVVRETAWRDNSDGKGEGGVPFGSILPFGDSGLLPRFRRDRTGTWSVSLSGSATGRICLGSRCGSVDEFVGRSSPEACSCGTFRLATGDWGILDFDGCSLFFQVVRGEASVGRCWAGRVEPVFVASLFVSLFLALGTVAISGLLWDPPGDGVRSQVPLKEFKVVARIEAQRDPEPLTLRDLEDPLEKKEVRERIRFEDPPEEKVILRPPARKPLPSQPLRASTQVISGTGGAEGYVEEAPETVPVKGNAKDGPVLAMPAPPAPPAQPAVDREALTRDFLQTIRDELMRNKRYPSAAQRMGLQGVIRVSFVILPDGSFAEIRLRRASGHEMLDSAAVETVASLSGKIRRPREIGHHPLKTSVILRFELG
jgi:TonB family protein